MTVANAGGRTVINQAELEDLMRGSEVARMLGRAGEVGTQEAKRLAPVSPAGHDGLPSGHLRSSIHWDLGEDGQGQYVDIIVDAEEALFVEFGTAPHVITSHGNYPLRSRDGRTFGRSVKHPGTDAQPFMRPAADAAARGV